MIQQAFNNSISFYALIIIISQILTLEFLSLLKAYFFKYLNRYFTQFKEFAVVILFFIIIRTRYYFYYELLSRQLFRGLIFFLQKIVNL